MLISRGARSGGALIKGILPEEEKTVSDLITPTLGSAAPLEPDPSDSGQTVPAANGPIPPILIGYDLANTLDAKGGDTVTIRATRTNGGGFLARVAGALLVQSDPGVLSKSPASLSSGGSLRSGIVRCETAFPVMQLVTATFASAAVRPPSFGVPGACGTSANDATTR